MDDKDQPFLIAKPVEDGNVSKVASQMEVANSVAFQNVDEQYYAGKLTSTEMAMFKARFIRLHQALKKAGARNRLTSDSFNNQPTSTFIQLLVKSEMLKCLHSHVLDSH
ncbi:unnamed protein product [Dibothriocephalus latus]|uniref:Uncharacterized protein n=1 Tax=Dibothriocephalus latus TaxID=60516 RepID=A0A3P6T7Q7_DIBLA|nr:unnamed protein product [Dibothriocephalus latus]